MTGGRRSHGAPRSPGVLSDGLGNGPITRLSVSTSAACPSGSFRRRNRRCAPSRRSTARSLASRDLATAARTLAGRFTTCSSALLNVLRVKLGGANWRNVERGLPISHSLLAEILAGRAEISTTIAFRVAKACGVSLQETGEAVPPGTCRDCGMPSDG